MNTSYSYHKINSPEELKIEINADETRKRVRLELTTIMNNQANDGQVQYLSDFLSRMTEKINAKFNENVLRMFQLSTPLQHNEVVEEEENCFAVAAAAAVTEAQNTEGEMPNANMFFNNVGTGPTVSARPVVVSGPGQTVNLNTPVEGVSAASIVATLTPVPPMASLTPAPPVAPTCSQSNVKRKYKRKNKNQSEANVSTVSGSRGKNIKIGGKPNQRPPRLEHQQSQSRLNQSTDLYDLLDDDNLMFSIK